ncbi:MAG: hypothetical protein AAFX52_08235 [Pseudomonadota bacterium]
MLRGFVTVLIALIGFYFSWESRRADNYQAVADLALSSDPNVAATAAETIEVMTIGCGGDAATDLQKQRLSDILCPLSTHHRFILTNMIDAIDGADAGTVTGSQMISQASEPRPIDRELTERTSQTVDNTFAAEAPVIRERELPARAQSPDRLLSMINDGSRSARRGAVAELERNSLGDGAVIDSLISQLEDPDAATQLTIQGRFNVVYLLNHAPDSVWESEERVERCIAAIDQMFAAERAGRMKLGDQTRSELNALRNRLRGMNGSSMSMRSSN